MKYLVLLNSYLFNTKKSVSSRTQGIYWPAHLPDPGLHPVSWYKIYYKEELKGLIINIHTGKHAGKTAIVKRWSGTTIVLLHESDIIMTGMSTEISVVLENVEGKH